MLKAHDQWPPFVRIDAVRIAINQDSFGQVYAADTHFDRYQPAAPPHPVRPSGD